MSVRPTVLALTALLATAPALAQPARSPAPAQPARSSEPLGIAMEGYPSPFPVQLMPVTVEGQGLRMAYMDVKPTARANGRTVILLHGKNFFGAYWQSTINALTAAGYRVVVPDQIGFGRSSKPDIHYSFHTLASLTKKLLDTLGIKETAVVGHSMGGMLATRFALMYPEATTHLVLENPIGLEDYREKVPWQSTEAFYREALQASEEGTRKYHQTYYVKWRPEYDVWIQLFARQLLSAEYPRLAWVSAATSQMIYEQPVSHEFPLVKPRTLLFLGQEDRTFIGRGKVPADVAATLGQYPQLGKAVAKAIPNATLVELPGVGHIPHFEAPEKFHSALLGFLGK